jgi:hypothetical protein
MPAGCSQFDVAQLRHSTAKQDALPLKCRCALSQSRKTKLEKIQTCNAFSDPCCQGKTKVAPLQEVLSGAFGAKA